MISFSLLSSYIWSSWSLFSYSCSSSFASQFVDFLSHSITFIALSGCVCMCVFLSFLRFNHLFDTQWVKCIHHAAQCNLFTAQFSSLHCMQTSATTTTLSGNEQSMYVRIVRFSYTRIRTVGKRSWRSSCDSLTNAIWWTFFAQYIHILFSFIFVSVAHSFLLH